MKLISTGLTTLLLAATAGAFAWPGVTQPAQLSAFPQTVAITSGDPQLDQPTSAPVSIPNVPIITTSGVLGTNHFIRLAVYGMTLKDLMITLPPQMERFSEIHILDQAGRELPAKISMDKAHIAIAFDEPVTPGNAVQVLFTGIQMQTGGGEIFLYELTGERVGLQGEIPIGTARVQVPSRS